MDKDKLVEAPLREVLYRKFVAYEGSHITLACGHTLVCTKPRHPRRMRCPDCAAALRSHAPK